jgi:hypothetical protein
MADFDINNQQDRIQYGGHLARLIAVFWIGAILGVWLGVTPFWEPTRGGFGHFGFAFWWALPVGIFGGYLHLHTRLALDRKAETARCTTAHPTNQEPATPHLATVAEPAIQAMPVANQVIEGPKPDIQFRGLLLGQSEGILHGRDHVGGIAPHSVVHLLPEDCCKNMIIFGGIGSGKTTRVINPALKQLFEQDAGALIFDIKSDFLLDVDYIARITGRRYVVVGDGGLTLNLLGATSPELAASYFKSCFIASGSVGGNGAFFVDTAVELCRIGLTLLQLSGGDYSLAGLYDMVFNADKRDEAIARMLAAESTFDSRQVRLAESVGNYFANIYLKFDEKMLSNVNSTVAQVLSPFTHPDLVDAFSGKLSENEADLTALMNEGLIYFVSLPMTKYGKEGARYAYMLIKLRFMSMMRERRMRSDWNRTRYVAFVCDEYQAIADSITDTDFWDKSRSSRCMGIVSMQGVSSLLFAVKDRLAAEANLQNFRQRLMFRTEDPATIEHAQKLLGSVDVLLTSTSTSSNVGFSESDSSKGSNVSRSQGNNEGDSTTLQRQQLFDSNDFRALSADYGLFIGNIGEHSADDVVHLRPLYIKE